MGLGAQKLWVFSVSNFHNCLVGQFFLYNFINCSLYVLEKEEEKKWQWHYLSTSESAGILTNTSDVCLSSVANNQVPRPDRLMNLYWCYPKIQIKQSTLRSKNPALNTCHVIPTNYEAMSTQSFVNVGLVLVHILTGKRSITKNPACGRHWSSQCAVSSTRGILVALVMDPFS